MLIEVSRVRGGGDGENVVKKVEKGRILFSKNRDPPPSLCLNTPLSMVTPIMNWLLNGSWKLHLHPIPIKRLCELIL